MIPSKLTLVISDFLSRMGCRRGLTLFPKCLFSTTVLVATLLVVRCPAAEKNVILFVTDDESPTLGCYGDTTAVTPNIDALAKDGVVFRNAFATTASCSASRSVILSGLHNHKNGQYGHVHEIQMYYPMRVVQDKRYKLIWNIAYKLDYPFASDLWAASSWQAQYQQGEDARYGQKTVGQYIHRPEFELYDLENDPDESYNLADKPENAELLKAYQQKMKTMQKKLEDPWIMKWRYQ